MALDFPTAPTNGQKYPASPIAGLPTYTWDGEKWTTVGGAIVSATPGTLAPLMDNTPAVVGSSTNFSREDHVHPVDTKAIRSDVVTSLTPAQQQIARVNEYAAPFDAMAYSGLQINGAMEVSQELGAGGVSVAGAAKYIVDGWLLSSVGAQVLTAAQSATAPPGFNNTFYVAPTTANPTPAVTNYCTFIHKIEGYRIARLQWGTANAQPITIGFWVDTNRPGNYSGSVANGAANRSYPFTFTVNGATTWEYKTITIPGCTDGTWAKDNTTGIQVNLCMMVGSNFQGAAGAWANFNLLGVTGSVNGVAATSDFMLISGFTVIPGSEGPSAARSPFIMRPYDQELVTCQRYSRWLPFNMYFMAYQAEQMSAALTFAIPMRAAPTVTAIFPDPALSGSTAAVNNASNLISMMSPNAAMANLAAAAAGGCYVFGYRSFADARL